MDRRLWLKIADYSGVIFSLLAGGMGLLASVIIVPGLTEFITTLSSLCYALAFAALFTNNEIFSSLLHNKKLKFSENEDIKKQRFSYIKNNKYIIALGLLAASMVFASIFVPVLYVVAAWLLTMSNFYEARAQIAKEKIYEKKLNAVDNPRVHEIYRERYFEKQRQSQFTTTLVVLSVASAVTTTVAFFVPAIAPFAYVIMGALAIGLGILAAQFFVRSKIHAYKSYKLTQKLQKMNETNSCKKPVLSKMLANKNCDLGLQVSNDTSKQLSQNLTSKNGLTFYSQSKAITENERDLGDLPKLRFP